MKTEELIPKIKSHEKYRGQLLLHQELKSYHPNGRFPLPTEFQSILDNLDLELYAFQGRAISSFLGENNLFMVGGYGIGISTTIELLSLHTIWHKNKTVLYLERSPERLENRSSRTKTSIRKNL